MKKYIAASMEIVTINHNNIIETSGGFGDPTNEQYAPDRIRDFGEI